MRRPRYCPGGGCALPFPCGIDCSIQTNPDPTQHPLRWRGVRLHLHNFFPSLGFHVIKRIALYGILANKPTTT
ncbi:hypothetical protein C8Q77DRAFT_1129394 [Trametes polyzona]|nr:hypothetical protein C8Q77DRAFT_1129394 [Trametes polyzona]